MTPDMDSAGWGVWSMHVLEELKRLNLELKNTNDKFDKNIGGLREDFENLRIAFIEFKTATVTEAKIKNGYWGAMAGAMVSIALWGLQYVLGH
jgi:hypothetical protein